MKTFYEYVIKADNAEAVVIEAYSMQHAVAEGSAMFETDLTSIVRGDFIRNEAE